MEKSQDKVLDPAGILIKMMQMHCGLETNYRNISDHDSNIGEVAPL